MRSWANLQDETTPTDSRQRHHLLCEILVSFYSLGLDTSWSQLFQPAHCIIILILPSNPSLLQHRYSHRSTPILVLNPNNTRWHWNHTYPNPGIQIALSCQSKAMKIMTAARKTAGKTKGGLWPVGILSCSHSMSLISFPGTPTFQERNSGCGTMKCYTRHSQEQHQRDAEEYWGLGNEHNNLWIISPRWVEDVSQP